MASQDMNISPSCNEGLEGNVGGKWGSHFRCTKGTEGGVLVWELFALGSTPIELGQLTMSRIKNATANEDTKKKKKKEDHFPQIRRKSFNLTPPTRPMPHLRPTKTNKN